MALAFYDQDKILFNTNPLRTKHNGYVGGPEEKLIYIKNDDSMNYYTDLVLSYEGSYDTTGEFGTSGWSIKFLFGERRPTESEWSSVAPGTPIELPDIGDTYAADTYTYYPVWVRMYCPGGSPASIRTDQKLVCTCSEQKVGA